MNPVHVPEPESIIEGNGGAGALSQPTQLSNDQLDHYGNNPRANGEIWPSQAKDDPTDRKRKKAAQCQGNQH